MPLDLDPSEVLSYLNGMGYRNITPQQLKDFIRDLKKLIKFERRYGQGHGQENYFSQAAKRFSRSENQKTVTTTDTDREPSKNHPPRKEKPSKDNEIIRPKSKSARGVEDGGDLDVKRLNLGGATKSTTVCVRNNPVDLFQKYQKDWERFKKFMPGENEHAGLRRQVREKLMVKEEPKKTVIVCLNEESGRKIFRRM